MSEASERSERGPASAKTRVEQAGATATLTPPFVGLSVNEYDNALSDLRDELDKEVVLTTD